MGSQQPATRSAGGRNRDVGELPIVNHPIEEPAVFRQENLLQQAAAMMGSGQDGRHVRRQRAIFRNDRPTSTGESWIAVVMCSWTP